MTDIFVYYRVASADAAQLYAGVTRLQAGLAARYGISTALKRRPEEKDGLQTWMEVYCAVPEGFAAKLALAAAEMRLPIVDERHVELFVDVTECA